MVKFLTSESQKLNFLTKKLILKPILKMLRGLKVQKKKGESFSDVILRTFPPGNPARILAVVDELPALDDATAKRIRKASKNVWRNFKAQVPDAAFRKGAGAKD